MTIEEPKSTNEASVPNDSDERTSRTQRVVSLRRSGLSFREIGDEIGVSKSTAFRIWKDANIAPQATTQAIGKRLVPSEQFDDMPAGFPDEPPEFMTDSELKTTAKRLAIENKIRRMRARGKWLDFVSRNPQRYQSYMAHDGHAKGDDFRDRVMLEDRKMLLELLKDKGKSNEGFGMKDFFNSVLSLQANQQKSNWEFYSRMVEALGNMRGSDLPADAQIALKRMEMEFQKWQTEKAESAKKWENIAAMVAPALGQLPTAIGGLFGKKRASNPKPGVTQMVCQNKNCGITFPVAVTDLEQRKPLECPVCHTTYKPIGKENQNVENEQVENNTSS